MGAEFARHPAAGSDESFDGGSAAASAREAGFHLDNDYREFIHRYGGAILGPLRIYGLRMAPPMGANEGSVFDVTLRYKRQGWPGVSEWLVISNDHAGNPIGIAADGRVWLSDHDFGEIILVAESFEGFVRKRCLELPE